MIALYLKLFKAPVRKTDHTGASLASKLQKFDEEGVLDPEHGELSLPKRLRSGAYKLHKQ